MTLDVEQVLSKLGPLVRQTLAQACDGEWGRVTVDERGSFTVHNHPPKPKPYVTFLKPVRPRARRTVKRAAQATSPQWKPPNETTPVPLVERPAHPVQAIRYTSEVVHVRPDPKAVANFDWDSVTDLEGACHALCTRFRQGLPMALGYSYMPDVLALEGMNPDSVESTLRVPERVEVAPESFDKKYAVLRFTRGDAMTVLGLREPTNPKIIAAYWGSKLANDTHRVNHTGGGGSKASVGLPGTVKAMLKQLRASGCVIVHEELSDDKTAPVLYHGQDLGKVTVGVAAKTVVQADYQRIVRKMQAIDRRVAVGS